MTARPGLNGLLSYPAGGVQKSFAVRVETVTHSLKPVFAESTGRGRRAFYPHRMSSAQFTLGLVLVGQAERAAFTGFLGDYAAALLDPGAGPLAAMSVSVPVRGFARRGVPLTGMEWGARVGQYWFRPQVVFETAAEPLDADPNPAASAVPQAAAVGDPNAQYFYPFGTQLSGDTGPGGSGSADPASWIPGPGLRHHPDPADWGS